MIRRPPRSTRTDALFPYTTLFRSVSLISVTVRGGRRRAGWRSKRVQLADGCCGCLFQRDFGWSIRSEEHTSELQSLMRISYAVFCLKKKTYLFIFLLTVSVGTHCLFCSHLFVYFYLCFLYFF